VGADHVVVDVALAKEKFGHNEDGSSLAFAIAVKICFFIVETLT
jgi:hypothetical protein